MTRGAASCSRASDEGVRLSSFNAGRAAASMSVEQTLAELVRMDSRSSNTNEAVIDYARARVEAAGLRTRVLSYADERGVEKFQLLAFAADATDEVELARAGRPEARPAVAA